MTRVEPCSRGETLRKVPVAVVVLSGRGSTFSLASSPWLSPRCDERASRSNTEQRGYRVPDYSEHATHNALERTGPLSWFAAPTSRSASVRGSCAIESHRVSMWPYVAGTVPSSSQVLSGWSSMPGISSVRHPCQGRAGRDAMRCDVMCRGHGASGGRIVATHHPPRTSPPVLDPVCASVVDPGRSGWIPRDT